MRDVITRVALWWLRRAAKGSSIVAHGLREMARSGMREDDPEDGPNKWMARSTHNLLAVFALEGHSGSSAAFARELFHALSGFRPWGALTGADDEWHDAGHGTFQNVRCSSVFKERDGRAYDIDRTTYRYPDGVVVTTGRFGRDYITFPYTPGERRVVDLNEDGEIAARKEGEG